MPLPCRFCKADPKRGGSMIPYWECGQCRICGPDDDSDGTKWDTMMACPSGLYLVVIWRDVDPELKGPYETPRQRDIAAVKLRHKEGDEHGLFYLDYVDGIPEISYFDYDEAREVDEDLQEFIKQHGGAYWTSECPDATREAWVRAIESKETRLGYWQWAQLHINHEETKA